MSMSHRIAPPAVAGATLALAVLALLARHAAAAPADSLRVGIVLDGASAATFAESRTFESEIRAFFGRGRAIRFIESAPTGWTAADVALALDHTLLRPDVDVV